MLAMVYQDEKVAKVLEMLQEGFTRDEIGDYYEQQWKSVDIYMQRKDFRWSNEQQTYIPKEDEPETKLEEAIQTINTKAAQIVRMLDVKHPNIRQTAVKQGFESIEIMGE